MTAGVTMTQRTEWAVLATPMVAFLLLFLGLPTILNLIYSVSEVRFETLKSPTLTGLQNYAAALADPAFWRATWFSTRFALVTATIQCVIGLALAIFLHPLLRERSWAVAILMMPLMVAPALVGLMYRLVLHEFVGPVPHYAYAFLGWSPSFLSGPTVFWTLVVIESLQWTPFAFLLFHMAYSAIPSELREAGLVDGAGAFDFLRFVELPLMVPTLVIAFFIRFIDGFRVFDNIFVLVGSGPGGSTASLSIYIYESFFRQGAIGRAVAASVILFLTSFAVLWALTRLAARRKS
jgi:multiple sugar transport system permease protein